MVDGQASNLCTSNTDTWSATSMIHGSGKFMSSTIIVSYIVSVEECLALMQKETLLSTNCHNGSKKGHFWITCHMHTVSCLIGTRVVIQREGCFFARILTVVLQQDGS
jgi:hypothetical protein